MQVPNQHLIYLDNAATSWPKPPVVIRTVQKVLTEAGGNPGRGGHILSTRAGEWVYHAREIAARFFQAEPENVVFTQNCTHALNLAIYGLLKPDDHVIISNLEHNSVARPIAAHCAYSVATVFPDPDQTVAQFKRLITSKTRAIVCTLVSNVTGQILPWKKIGLLCQSAGIPFIVDGAQACGILPISMRDGIQILCTAGHKGLYGMMGTGMLITDGSVSLRSLMQGGTGSLSHQLAQPDFLPDALEAGTVNVPGIASLAAGMKWINRMHMDVQTVKETAACLQCIRGLRRIPDAIIYREADAAYAPVVSFRLQRESPSATAKRLHEKGFCVRAGLHCAPFAHQALGTVDGTVRFAPSSFTQPAEIAQFLYALQKG